MKRFINELDIGRVPTIYPPVTQMVFSFSTLIQPDSLVFMKFIFVLF